MVEVVEVAQLDSWTPAWDSLAGLATPPSPFLRSWWLTRQAASARFVLVVEEGRLLGGIALQADRWLGVHRLRMLGSGVLCPDHLDAVVAPDSRDVVVRALRGWFATTRGVVLDLGGLAAGAVVIEVLDARPERIDVAPYGDVPTGTAGRGYLGTRSRNLRRSAGKADRRLTDDGYVHRRADARALPRALARFEDLHRERPDRADLLAELPTLGRCLGAGLESGEARVDLLQRADEAPVAVAVTFWVERRLSMYQVARSLAPEHNDVGTVLILRVIDDAVAAGAIEIDMLRGDEGYKTRLVDSERSLYRVRVARGALPRLLVAALRSASWARRRAKRL